MKLLYLCQRVPYPPDRGDRIVAYHQIRHLSRRHQVTVASLANGNFGEAESELRRNMGVTLIAPEHSRVRQASGMAASLLHGEPLSLGHFFNPVLRDSLAPMLRHGLFDAALIYSSSMAQYVENLSGMPRIMHFCDVDSQKWMDLSERRKGLMRWIFKREGRLLLAYERKIAGEFTASCVVTQHEAKLFQRCIPGVPVCVLENGVDFEYFSGMPRSPQGLQLVFVGVMDYPPNVEAVSYFADRIWPAVFSKRPDARFIIVGSRPNRAVRRLAERPGIETTGYVRDIRPYLSNATLLVAPLEIARGVQNKILEAMAAGLPVLTTPVVAKGLPPRAQSMIVTSDRDPAQFTFKLLSIIEDSRRLEERAEAAREFVKSFCSWDAKLQHLDLLLEEATKAKCKREIAANF
jgi:polysaccharide biosynthesis protein PslH